MRGVPGMHRVIVMPGMYDVLSVHGVPEVHEVLGMHGVLGVHDEHARNS